MLNINNIPWEKLQAEDVKEQISRSEMAENFYFEFKEDEESPAKLCKEICAFSNTYGGYVFLGIDDQKKIKGCHKWTENRVHTTIHDSISPIPVFDVKTFSIDGSNVLVIRIEEGTYPPYIVNDGRIYERVSSGSFPIKDSVKLTELYRKKVGFYDRVSKTIELPPIDTHSKRFPENVSASIDVGCLVKCRERLPLFPVFNDRKKIEEISSIISKHKLEYCISRIGQRLVITLNKQTAKDKDGNSVDLDSGLQNFLEILNDGSFRYRIILANDRDTDRASITIISYLVLVYSDIYHALIGDHFSDAFLYAEKCEKLSVFRQFTPYYHLNDDNDEKIIRAHKQLAIEQVQTFGGNHITIGNRFPTTGYLHFDHAVFDEFDIKWETGSIIQELFSTVYGNLGFIDIPQWQ